MGKNIPLRFLDCKTTASTETLRKSMYLYIFYCFMLDKYKLTGLMNVDRNNVDI